MSKKSMDYFGALAFFCSLESLFSENTGRINFPTGQDFFQQFCFQLMVSWLMVSLKIAPFNRFIVYSEKIIFFRVVFLLVFSRMT